MGAFGPLVPGVDEDELSVGSVAFTLPFQKKLQAMTVASPVWSEWRRCRESATQAVGPVSFALFRNLARVELCPLAKIQGMELDDAVAFGAVSNMVALVQRNARHTATCAHGTHSAQAEQAPPSGASW